ncbi:MAG TPA: DUF6456 domain-containing protein [Rhizomicrobium sp.]|jgi:hypothetical protein|nr:DUF6456 domain-containing protein [Rhizomicrobium sp.]
MSGSTPVVVGPIAAGEIEREARRLFRKLAAPGAHLARDGAAYRLVGRGARGAVHAVPVPAALVDGFAARGWLRRAGAAGTYVLSDAGEGWFKRAAARAAPFAAQHGLLQTRKVTDADGIARFVTVDEGESPLARLRVRGLIDAMQFDAGEKLRRDFTLAQLMPRLGVDYSSATVTGQRGQKTSVPLSDTVLSAKQRFAAAMRAVGAGLSDLLFDVCCHLRGLEELERAHAWPSRSGRVVLGIALDRLAEHYGMNVRSRAKVRGWAMEGDG